MEKMVGLQPEFFSGLKRAFIRACAKFRQIGAPPCGKKSFIFCRQNRQS